MKELEWSHFSHYNSMGIFPDTQGQLTLQSIVRSGRISNLFWLWLSILPARMKKIRSKIMALVFKTLYINFSDAQGQITVGGGIWPKLELIQAFMHVPVTCKSEDDSMKNDGATVVTTFLPLSFYGDFSTRARAANSAVRSPVSKLSEMLWLSSLPARMKKIRSKLKALEWSQDFPHYNPITAIRCHGNQSCNPTWPKT